LTILEVAKSAAHAGGKVLMEHFGRLSASSIRVKSDNDFISFVDEQSEKTILGIIREAFPDHSFLAEEIGRSGHTNPYHWLIDPLDGTRNYLSGIPIFCISIALQYNDELICGVVFDPVRNELFSAAKGQGAFLNDQPVHVSDKTHLSECLLATGFPFKTRHILPKYLQAFERVFLSCISMRRMGSAAIDMAYVAAGRFDAYWEIGVGPWDVAAGAVLIAEAGGNVTDFWNKPDFVHNSHVLASNGKIHRELSDHLQNVFPFFIPHTERPSGGQL
jgi:myo-inositol-1(or 4)-monophosphatase